MEQLLHNFLAQQPWNNFYFTDERWLRHGIDIGFWINVRNLSRQFSKIDQFCRTATTRSAPINSGAIFIFDLTSEASPPNSSTSIFKTTPTLLSSCAEILRVNANSESGMYWIMPEYSDDPIAAYCDMTSWDGGWQMCYTDWKEVDLKNSLFDASFDFGNEGYRSDCSKTPFDEIIYFDHDYRDLQALVVAHEVAFQYQGRNSIVAILSDWNGTALGLNGFPVSFMNAQHTIM